ncbi:MAG: hypothetical protein LBH44_07940 [Treponema sp.]|jgi:hypothetical protein|nr:hypothetical protein [Treponema sp.]
MSVRATGRLIGKLVTVPDIENGPQMVVKAFDPETNLITTVWFSDSNVYQEGTFPAAALVKTELIEVPQSTSPKKGSKANPKR